MYFEYKKINLFNECRGNDIKLYINRRLNKKEELFITFANHIIFSQTILAKELLYLEIAYYIYDNSIVSDEMFDKKYIHLCNERIRFLQLMIKLDISLNLLEPINRYFNMEVKLKHHEELLRDYQDFYGYNEIKHILSTIQKGE